MIATLVVAIIAFTSTNIDDLFVLIAFFSQKAYRPAQVVVGQYLGIGFLMVVSVLCAFISLRIAPTYIGLLGILPILFGVSGLWRLPLPDEQDALLAGSARKYLAVAIATIANGGDNIATYTPLFATIRHSEFLITILVFALMTGLWCIVGHWLAYHRLFKTFITYWGHRILPFVLIALGFYILWHTGAFVLFEKL